MRKLTTLFLSLCLLALGASCASAAGTTLRTFTPFADVDFAAQSYMDLITRWEEETGNMIEDYSGAMDEAWFAELAQMVAAGEVDVVVLPVGSGLTANELVTAKELMEAAPDIGVRGFAGMQDGGVQLLSPVRLNWEALYVNTDVLARYGLSAPKTFEELLAACAVLSQSGVTPIANALCEWSEIVLDCAALAGAPLESYGQQASLAGAQDVLVTLAMVGAFGGDPWNMSDMDAEAAFLGGEAAMRIDTDALAQMIDASREEHVVVVPLPAKDGQDRFAVPGAPGYGVAITRACWQDDARSAAAVDFVARLLGDASLVSPRAGALGESIFALTKQTNACAGLLYDTNPDGFDTWTESVVAMLMSL